MQPNKGESFQGVASEMKESDWLAVEDIEDFAPVNVKVEDVILHRNVAFEAGRREPKVYSLKFAAKRKQLPLNATNRRAMQKAYTSDTKQWRGKSITLTVEPLKREFNGHTHGIRIAIGGK